MGKEYGSGREKVREREDAVSHSKATHVAAKHHVPLDFEMTYEF